MSTNRREFLGSGLLLASLGMGLSGSDLPAIAVPALGKVDHLYGALNAINGNPKWLYKTSNLAIAATRRALDETNVPRAAILPLAVGETELIVVPREHLATFGRAMPDLKVVRGLVVPKDAKETDIYAVAPVTLPNVTYMSLNVKVKQLSGLSGPKFR